MPRRRRRGTGNPHHCYVCGQFCDSTHYCDRCFLLIHEQREQYAKEKHRDRLGQLVREVWIAWANEQPDIADHPHWLVPWERLAPRDREVDRRIGERLYAEGYAAGQDEAEITQPDATE